MNSFKKPLVLLLVILVLLVIAVFIYILGSNGMYNSSNPSGLVESPVDESQVVLSGDESRQKAFQLHQLAVSSTELSLTKAQTAKKLAILNALLGK
jgi:hypothetical protein